MQLIAAQATPWMAFVSCGIVLRMLSITVCGEIIETPKSGPELPSELPCPEADKIHPCHCTFWDNKQMDIDCSNVTSEDELRSIFNQDFSFTNFNKLNITNNFNIKTLREGDFGAASFKEIRIKGTSLGEVQNGALKGSYQTLVTLLIDFSSLTSVPDISHFTHLENLQLYGNLITNVPTQSSATLLKLDLSQNHIDNVSSETIAPLLSLEELRLNENLLTEIYPDTFTQNKNLGVLRIRDNLLTTIPNDAITLYGENTSLYLFGNQITSFSYGAVSSVTGVLELGYNNLTELPENVFRPLLERFVQLEVYDNPFKCGCDMAWLVLNETLRDRLANIDEVPEPTCYDEETFTSLDPGVYKVMCPNATAVPV